MAEEQRSLAAIFEEAFRSRGADDKPFSDNIRAALQRRLKAKKGVGSKADILNASNPLVTIEKEAEAALAAAKKKSGRQNKGENLALNQAPGQPVKIDRNNPFNLFGAIQSIRERKAKPATQ